MKKIIPIITIVLILFSAFAFAGIANSAKISVNLINQNPDPVEPGQLLELRWKVDNDGGSIAQNVRVRIIPEYPFTLLPGEAEIKEIGTLQGLQNNEEGVIIKYKLQVAQQAIQGDMPLSIEYSIDDKEWQKTGDYYITIQTVDAVILVENYEVPERVAPGKVATVSIDLKNHADSYMKDVSVKLELASYNAGVIDLDFLPFSTIGSSTEKRINSFAPKETKTITYELISYATAEPKVYKIPVTLTYYDELDNEQTTNELITLVVGSEPDLELVVDNVVTSGENYEVTLKFVNKGIADLKFLNINFAEDDSFELVSSRSEYVGNIDSDDYETASFKITDLSENKNIFIPMVLDYKDSNNYEYSKTVSTSVNLNNYIQESKNNNNATIVIAIIILCLGIFWFYRKRKNKK